MLKLSKINLIISIEQHFSILTNFSGLSGVTIRPCRSLHRSLGPPLGIVPSEFHIATFYNILSSALQNSYSAQLSLRPFYITSFSLNHSISSAFILCSNSLFSVLFLEPKILLNILISLVSPYLPLLKPSPRMHITQ